MSGKIVAIMMALASAAVQAGDFRVLADRKADFSSFKTFRIDTVTITRSSGNKVRQENVDRLRAAVSRQLVHEGLKESTGQADVVVNVVAGVDAHLQASETQGMPYFDGTWHVLPKEESGNAGKPASEIKYNQATLRIDIRDIKNNGVVWRALVSDLVRLPVSEQKVADVLGKAFEQYPPPPVQ